MHMLYCIVFKCRSSKSRSNNRNPTVRFSKQPAADGNNSIETDNFMKAEKN